MNDTQKQEIIDVLVPAVRKSWSAIYNALELDNKPNNKQKIEHAINYIDMYGGIDNEDVDVLFKECGYKAVVSVIDKEIQL